MGKRKQTVPQKAGEEKRRILTWNMMDNATTEDQLIDDSPELETSETANQTKSAEVAGTADPEPDPQANTVEMDVKDDSLNNELKETSYRRDELDDLYRLHLDNCLFSIPILTEPKVKDRKWRCTLAEFVFRFCPSPIFVPLPTDGLPEAKQFSLSISGDGQKDILSYENLIPLSTGKMITCGKDKGKIRTEYVKDVKFWLVDTDLSLYCLEALKCKTFQVVVKDFNTKEMSVTLMIMGTEAILTELSCPGEAVRSTRQQNRGLQVLFEHFHGVIAPDYDDLPFTKKHDIDGLYGVIKERHAREPRVVRPGVQHPDLLPTLRPYQQQAITWMLEKEHVCSEPAPEIDELHILYDEVRTCDGQTLYYNKYAGVLLKDRPVRVHAGPGGILGDEMGLGKTVEVLACMLHNPREQSPLPEPLPVIDEQIEAEKSKKKSRKKRRRSESSSEESDDTVIYAEKYSKTVSQSRDDGEGTSGRADDTQNQSSSIDESHISKLEGDESAMNKDSKPEKVKKTTKNIFTERPRVHRAEFECLCGATGAERPGGRRNKKKHTVQCTGCRLLQHAECVNYDLSDPYRGEFKCPHCHVASDPITSGATLIISPFSIAHQWVEEILKHVKKEAINVFMYNGVHKQGFIQPRTLAKQDIVITTYETLRKEIDYVDLPHSNSSEGRKLRHAKRFMAIPSPMTAVQWWRICLDEAQMVECTTTKTAEMALRLSAVNRWCVTGTPVQRSIDDLYGLLLFLGVDPYWVHMWWQELIFRPFCHGLTEPMYKLLSSVMWRTVKDDVLDQINIPEQSDEIQWLTFSPVEEHFYRRQYRDCVRLSMERLSKWTDANIRLSSLDRHTVSQLLYPLVRLRQACCHPQAVRGEFLPLHKSTMTMEELLDSLTKKAKLEAEESHRALVAAVNGEAGLHIIHEQFPEAVEKYREVLRSVEEHKDTLKTDSLQQLHAMYNLHEILVSKPEGIAPTLRDDQLPKQIDELRDKYMAKAVAYVKSTEEALIPAQVDVQQLKREFVHREEWWLDIVQWAIDRDLDDTLVMKVRDDLLDNRNPNINNLVRSCRSAAGLEYAVQAQLCGLEKAYTELLQSMKQFTGKPSQELINKTTECCLRPVGEILKNCPFCECEVLFETYEAKLFSFVEKGVEGHADHLGFQVNTRRQGTWADSEVEKALKSILSFGKHYRASDEFIESGSLHVKLLEAMKKEYKKLHTYWAGIKEHVASFDELDMSTTRLRLRLPDEPKPDTPQLNILEKSELSQHKLKLASDRIVAQGELRKKLGQLLYLTNLAKTQTDNKNGFNPDPCPVCQQELGKEWSVMQCGHCYCIECIRILVERASFGRRNFSVRCAICRQPTHQGEISYVMTAKEPKPDEVAVKGSHSTKVEAVVRCLLQIQREDPGAKSLVFSTWTDVLSVIATALDQNGISYKALYSAGKFQENLISFRQEQEVTTLLLPVHSGANGLNLIEATHVLLVEPILNPAQELQAIGRVHRIGQTRSTHVHRFLIKHTIEQKMHVLLQSMDRHNLPEKSEESSLTIGDLSSLFAQQVEEEDREGVQSHGEDEDISDSVRPSTSSEGCSQGLVRPSTSSEGYSQNQVKPTTSSEGCSQNLVRPSTSSEECNQNLDRPSTSAKGCRQVVSSTFQSETVTGDSRKNVSEGMMKSIVVEPISSSEGCNQCVNEVDIRSNNSIEGPMQVVTDSGLKPNSCTAESVQHLGHSQTVGEIPGSIADIDSNSRAFNAAASVSAEKSAENHQKDSQDITVSTVTGSAMGNQTVVIEHSYSGVNPEAAFLRYSVSPEEEGRNNGPGTPCPDTGTEQGNSAISYVFIAESGAGDLPVISDAEVEVTTVVIAEKSGDMSA